MGMLYGGSILRPVFSIFHFLSLSLWENMREESHQAQNGKGHASQFFFGSSGHQRGTSTMRSVTDFTDRVYSTKFLVFVVSHEIQTRKPADGFMHSCQADDVRTMLRITCGRHTSSAGSFHLKSPRGQCTDDVHIVFGEIS